MKKIFLIIIVFLSTNIISAQTKTELSIFLDNISQIQNSKDIIETNDAKKIFEYGENQLKILSHFFADQTKTRIKSDCLNRNLKKGELAIILADNIKRMPYAKLTGIQNCILEFCKENPNLIEFYLPSIAKDNAKKFTQNYNEWLKIKP